VEAGHPHVTPGGGSGAAAVRTPPPVLPKRNPTLREMRDTNKERQRSFMLENRFCTSRRLAVSIGLIALGIALVVIGAVLEASGDAGSLPLTLGIVMIGVTVAGLMLFYRRFKIERTNARQRMEFVNASQQSLVAEYEVLNYRSSGRVQRFVTPRDLHSSRRLSGEKHEEGGEGGGGRTGARAGVQGSSPDGDDQKDAGQGVRGPASRGHDKHHPPEAAAMFGALPDAPRSRSGTPLAHKRRLPEADGQPPPGAQGSGAGDAGETGPSLPSNHSEGRGTSA